MADQTVLARRDEVRRHGEEPVGARLLRGPRELDGERRAVSGAGDDRHPARAHLDRGGDDRAELLRAEGVELTRAAAGEDRGRAGVDAAAHMRPEGIEVDGAVRPVRSHGEEQQTIKSAGERG